MKDMLNTKKEGTNNAYCDVTNAQRNFRMKENDKMVPTKKEGTNNAYCDVTNVQRRDQHTYKWAFSFSKFISFVVTQLVPWGCYLLYLHDEVVPYKYEGDIVMANAYIRYAFYGIMVLAWLVSFIRLVWTRKRRRKHKTNKTPVGNGMP